MKEYKKPVLRIIELNFAQCILNQGSGHEGGDEDDEVKTAKKGSLIDFENE